MVINEPPPLPDDTQPTNGYTYPTQPSSQRRLSFLPTWLLFSLGIISAITLLATLIVVLRRSEPIGTTPIHKQVMLIVAGTVEVVDTQAATVGDLLREQAIRLQPEDAISTSLDTLLMDGMQVTINRARTVTLVIDGEARDIDTPFTHPRDILQNNDIVLNPSDRIWLDGTETEQSALQAWPVPVNEIVIQQAVEVTIVDNGTELTVATTAATVGDTLFEANITLYLTDEVTPDISSPIRRDMRIVINRALPVTIRVDGTVLGTRVQGETVADALTEAGIALIGLDYTIPGETEAVTASMTIHVLRVTEEIVSTEETVPFATTMQADAQMELDQRRTIQTGQPGTRRIDERVRYENGVEVGREPAGSVVTTPPQNEIITYGTNVVVRTIETPTGLQEYWRKLRVYATSYHPQALDGDNVTAIGMTLQHGVFGANPLIIPFRTHAYIPDYGTGIMADTGGSRSSPYWIDLGYSDGDYVSWHRYVDIYLLTPVPDTINYLLPVWQPMAGLPDSGP